MVRNGEIKKTDI